MKKFYLFLLTALLSVPTLLAGQVSFYFQDGEEADDFEIEYPSQYVSIFNNSTEEPVAVPQDMSYMPFEVTEATILKIYPEDFDFELVVSVEGDEDMYILDQEGNEWFLTLLENADELDIFVKVYLEGQVPGGGDKVSEVTMSFIVSGNEGVDNPGEVVSISYFDRTTFQETTVALSDGSGSVDVVPGTSFTIAPAEGYAVSDISTFTTGVATISQPGEGDTEWYIAVDESPADSFASFFVTVSKDASDEPEEPATSAVIKQIEPLQWTVTWEDFDFVDALDSEYDQNYAYLTDSKGAKTILHANLHGLENPTIIFPESGNYFTVNLEGLGLAEGTYELTIPAGYVNLGLFGVSKEPNPVQNFSITVGDTPDISYTVQISSIQDNYFDISWDNVTALAEGTTTGAYIEDVATGKKYEMLFLEDFNYTKANLRIYNGNALRVNVTNNYPQLPSGTYKFYLPANYVKFNGTETGNEAIEGYEFDYEKPWSEGRVEFNGPSADNKVTLTWVDASEILYDTEFTGYDDTVTGVTIYDSFSIPVAVPYDTNITIDGNVMTVDLNGLGLVDGECSILVPEGFLFVTVDDVTDYNDSVTFKFTYGDENDDPDTPELYKGEAEWSVATGDTLEEGELVEVGWGDFELAFVEDVEPASIYNPTTGILYLEYGTDVYLSEDKTKIVVSLDNMPMGIFRINIPEGCVEFEVDGVKYLNQSTSMDNVTNGIEGIISDGGHTRVVNLNGVVVLDTENASDLETLPAGIYIVNGKKVVK